MGQCDGLDPGGRLCRGVSRQPQGQASWLNCLPSGQLGWLHQLTHRGNAKLACGYTVACWASDLDTAAHLLSMAPSCHRLASG